MNESFLFCGPRGPCGRSTGPGSAFWPPLAFASMAAALRQAFAGLDMAILDARRLRWVGSTLPLRCAGEHQRSWESGRKR